MIDWSDSHKTRFKMENGDSRGFMEAPLAKLYPAHAAALRKANLVDQETLGLPMNILREKCDKEFGRFLEDEERFITEEEKEEKKRLKKKENKRKTYFCIGISTIWKKPIHVELKELRNQFDLKWLRISMSYHRFANLKEKLLHFLVRCSRDF